MARRDGTSDLLYREKAYLSRSESRQHVANRKKALETPAAQLPEGVKHSLEASSKKTRKHRKLRKLAEKKGIGLPQLLRKRARQRHRLHLKESIGQVALLNAHHYGYVVELLSLEPERQLKVRVLGYTKIYGPHPPYSSPFDVGSEHTVEDRKIREWQIGRCTPRTIEACVQDQISHCDRVLSEKMSQTDERWRDSWTKTRESWLNWDPKKEKNAWERLENS